MSAVCGCPCVSTSHLKGAKIWQQAAYTHQPPRRPAIPPRPSGLTNSVQISTEQLERVAAGRSCLKSFLNITARSEGWWWSQGGWGQPLWGLGVCESEMFVCSPHFFCTYAHIANSLGFTWLPLPLPAWFCHCHSFFSWLSDLGTSPSSVLIPPKGAQTKNQSTNLLATQHLFHSRGETI